ncbi:MULTISPECIES: DUF938 domain-containing protein [unclassified Rhizobium]|uniref:DUF938 domain-containing protein n=1 Tax=unclassified Rhizobium TaxID=2613769 RepID=UPI001FD9A981|nr:MULTISPECIES: DUF938 domain-containing protein [unclassified Rhizobium]
MRDIAQRGFKTPLPTEKEDRSPVALEQRNVSADQRLFSPAVARNSAPILAVLKRVLPTHGTVLEIGCWTGEHAVCFAGAMPNLTWEPSDPDADGRASTSSWIKFAGLKNALAPRDIDVCSEQWGVEQTGHFDAIASINMIHIAPWAASLGLFAGAGVCFARVGFLFSRAHSCATAHTTPPRTLLSTRL